MNTNDIFIVTNDIYVTDKCMFNLYQSDEINAVKSSDILEDDWSPKFDSCWQDIINGVPVEKGYVRSTSSKYNIYRLPLAGIIYAAKYSRMNNETDRRVMIISVKEPNPTPIVTMEKYHVLLNSRFVPPLTFFKDWFDDVTRNVFLSEDYDFLINLGDSGISGMSSFYENLVGNGD